MITEKHIGKFVWLNDERLGRIVNYRQSEPKPVYVKVSEGTVLRHYKDGRYVRPNTRQSWGTTTLVRPDDTGHAFDIARFVTAQELTEHVTTDELIIELQRRHGECANIIRDVLYEHSETGDCYLPAEHEKEE